MGLFLLITMSSVFAFQIYGHIGIPLRQLITGDHAKTLAGRADVFGELASRLAKSEEDLTARDELLEFQRKSFDALLSIYEVIGSDLSIKGVFDHALDALGEATDFVSIGIRLYEEKSKSFRLISHFGISPAMLEVLEAIPEDKGFQAEALRTKWPYYTSDIPTASNLVGRVALDLDYRSIICVPLLAGEQVLGTIELVTDQQHHWSESEVRWLALVGRSLGILIRNVQLTDRLKEMTVLQERSRLAQEIHDGLAQLIGALRLWAEEAQISLKKQNFRAVDTALQKIENTSRDAYASIREEILGLRDTVVPGENILSVMTEYLSRFQRQWGIATKISYINGLEPEAGLFLSPSTEIQLLRIFQEGLTNVRRHAEATQILVTIENRDKFIRISIQDNGKGFNPNQISDENLGLRIMRERAASIEGSVKITSRFGKGTNLEIVVPKKFG